MSGIRPSEIKSGFSTGRKSRNGSEISTLKQDAGAWLYFFRHLLTDQSTSSMLTNSDRAKIIFALGVFEQLEQDANLNKEWLAALEKQFPDIASQKPINRASRLRKQATAKVSGLLFGQGFTQNYELERTLRQIMVLLRKELKVSNANDRAAAAGVQSTERLASTIENKSYMNAATEVSLLLSIAQQSLRLALPTIKSSDYIAQINACLEDERVVRIYQSTLVKTMGEQEVRKAPGFQRNEVDLGKVLLDPTYYAKNDLKAAGSAVFAQTLANNFLSAVEKSDIPTETKQIILSANFHNTAIKLIAEIESAFKLGDLQAAKDKHSDFRECCDKLFKTPLGLKLKDVFERIGVEVQHTIEQIEHKSKLKA